MEKKITLPQIFADGMVLQREQEIRIFGSADEGTRVTAVLRGPEGEAKAQAAADSEGAFLITLAPQKPGTGYELELSADDASEPEITIKDVCVGDVWLACGQSNMEYYLRYDAHWNDVQHWQRDPEVRMFNVPRISYEGQPWRHEEDSGFWFQEGHEAWGVFSAPGYAFARKIRETQGVPVGVIGCNWGGTKACCWIEESYLREEPLNVFNRDYQAEVDKWDPAELEEASLKAFAHENSYRHELEWRTVMYGLTRKEQDVWMREHANDPELPLGPWHYYRPSGLYHTMLETIAPLAVKGVLWYQGESDDEYADIYDQTMKALIQCYRDTFRNETLPFLFVQLAPFGTWLDISGELYPAVREKQDHVAHVIPYTAMTSVMDLGDRIDIHPKYKIEVGERLALLARGHVYGENILCDPPEFHSAEMRGKTFSAPDPDSSNPEGSAAVIRMHFLHAEGGLTAEETPEYDPSSCFRLFADEKEIPAGQVRTEDDMIELQVQIPEGTALLRISFAEEAYTDVRIRNAAGLPVKPFHTQLEVELG